MKTKRTVRVRLSKDGSTAVPVRRPRAMVTKKTATAIRKIAKSVVRKEAETKFVSDRQDWSFNSAISGPGECYPVMPPITQGVDDYQRIGDRVRGRYLYIKGHIQYNSAWINTPGVDNYVPPSTIRVLILSQKNIKTNGQIATSADTAHLLKDNVGTGVGRSYTGGMTDNLAPINKDLFKVHLDKKVKMKVVYQNIVGGQGGSGWVGLPTAYFTCRVKMPATLYFDDTNGNNLNNFAPFFCLGSVLDDGSAPFSLGQPYRVTWLSTAYFDDA